MYTIILDRTIGKKTGDEKVRAQVDYIVARGLAGPRGKTWTVNLTRLEPVQVQNGWKFKYKAVFEKIRGDRNGNAEYTQWEEIKAMMIQTGAGTRWQGQNWNISEPQQQQVVGQTLHNAGIREPETDTPVVTQQPVQQPEQPESLSDLISDVNNTIVKFLGVSDVQNFGPAKKWEDLYVPPELLGPDSDQYLSQHEAWMNLYGVNPQIRILLSNIKRANETGGESRNHAVLFGHAGCGKTTTMKCLEKMFGTGSVLKLDATSTTKAGLEKMFFNELKEIPPIVLMEEAEKADVEALKIWLGALDDRGEIRKVNFKVNQLREIKILFICSVNNKPLFDRMMGSDGTENGALSSRCVTQIYYPRPSNDVLRQILEKEIRDHGGDERWIDPAIEMAEKMDISDPRIVRSYLAGGDRLLDSTYQRDWLAVYEAQKAFNR